MMADDVCDAVQRILASPFSVCPMWQGGQEIGVDR